MTDHSHQEHVPKYEKIGGIMNQNKEFEFYESISVKMNEDIHYYNQRRKKWGRWAKFMRFFYFLFFYVGVALPVFDKLFSQYSQNEIWKHTFEISFALIFFSSGIAQAMEYFGWLKGWRRVSVTAQKLENIRSAMELEYQGNKIANLPSDKLAAICQEHWGRFKDVVIHETDTWGHDFKKDLDSFMTPDKTVPSKKNGA
ncbi:MAG: SLATT domain-containing protein [Magnetococcales bacterium]|nr:SLATT domain-containing protein [Magnetococcales bacterium]